MSSEGTTSEQAAVREQEEAQRAPVQELLVEEVVMEEVVVEESVVELVVAATPPDLQRSLVRENY